MGATAYPDTERGLRDRVVGELVKRALHDTLRASLITPLTVQTPAAGADWALVVPNTELWELHSVRFTLTASATVANRLPGLSVLNPDGVAITEFPTPNAVTAGQASLLAYLAGLGLSSTTQAWATGLPSPPFVLRPNQTLGTKTSNLQAADQFSTIQVVVRRLSIAAILEQARRIADGVGAIAPGVFGIASPEQG